MTAAREAIYLPVICLTVVLLGGLRLGAEQVLVPPSLFALVLGVMLIGVLIRSGALAAGELVGDARSAVENVNGCVLLATLLLACAQAFTMLTPESGLPRLAVSVYFLVLMLNTWAADPDRVRVLRSLAVTFGAAFLLNFVVLDALSEPAGGTLKRVLQTVLEGITLGVLTQRPHHSAAGYLAFLTVGLFLIAVAALPARRPVHARRTGIDGVQELTRIERGDDGE